jgi:hypothetical protein
MSNDQGFDIKKIFNNEDFVIEEVISNEQDENYIRYLENKRSAYVWLWIIRHEPNIEQIYYYLKQRVNNLTEGQVECFKNTQFNTGYDLFMGQTIDDLYRAEEPVNRGTLELEHIMLSVMLKHYWKDKVNIN